MDKIYEDFTANVLPKISEGLSMTKDYFFDLFGRYVHYFIVVDSMTKAIEMTKDIVKEGDVVLLSPGAASFGLFSNEFDRGNKFKKIVEELK